MPMTSSQIDTLREIVNIGFGRMAGVLNNMLKAEIQLKVPIIKEITAARIADYMTFSNDEDLSSVKLDFSGKIAGKTLLLFPGIGAQKIVSALTGEKVGTRDLLAMQGGALAEVGSIVINGIMTSLGGTLNGRMRYSLPSYSKRNLDDIIETDFGTPSESLILAQAFLWVEQLDIKVEVTLMFLISPLDVFYDSLNKYLKKVMV